MEFPQNRGQGSTKVATIWEYLFQELSLITQNLPAAAKGKFMFTGMENKNFPCCKARKKGDFSLLKSQFVPDGFVVWGLFFITSEQG